jgi:hypothetical protein
MIKQQIVAVEKERDYYQTNLEKIEENFEV